MARYKFAYFYFYFFILTRTSRTWQVAGSARWHSRSSARSLRGTVWRLSGRRRVWTATGRRRTSVGWTRSATGRGSARRRPPPLPPSGSATPSGRRPGPSPPGCVRRLTPCGGTCDAAALTPRCRPWSDQCLAVLVAPEPGVIGPGTTAQLLPLLGRVETTAALVTLTGRRLHLYTHIITGSWHFKFY